MLFLKALLLTLLLTYVAAAIFRPDLIANTIVKIFKTDEIAAGKLSAVVMVVAILALMYLLN